LKKKIRELFFKQKGLGEFLKKKDNMSFARPKEVTQLGKTKLSKDGGGVTLDATCVYFCDSKYGQWSPHCTDASSNMVVILENLQQLVPDGKTIRVNPDTGLLEALAAIKVDNNKEESPAEYFRRNIDDYLRGEYLGSFDEMDKYWDKATNDFHKSRWVPIQDVLKNPPMLKLSNWVKNFPKDRLVQGVQIQIVSCSFQIYLRLEKAKGAAKAQQNVLAQVVTSAAAPSTPGDALAESAAAAAALAAKQGKRVPQAFLGLNTNAGVTVRGSYVEGTPPLEIFKGLVADRKHYMCLPQSNNESFCIVQRLEGYQAYQTGALEPGPSVICERQYSLDKRSFMKTTPGQSGAPDTHEAIWQLSYNVCQYKEGPAPTKRADGTLELRSPDEFPWTLNGILNGPQLSLTGITRLDDWVRYGPTEWRGVAVFAIQAGETRRLALNQPGQANANGWSGQVNSYVKGFFPDLRATLKDQGLPVDVNILKTLYSDVFQRLTSKNDDGTEEEVISLHLDKFKGKGRSSGANLLHLLGNDDVININECEKNIGHLLAHSQLYVLPYIPIPRDVLQQVQGDNFEAVRLYRREVVAHLRATLGTGEKLIEVLLGFKDAPPLNKTRTNLLYTSDEITSLSGVQQALAKDKKKNDILPTVLVGRNMPRDNSVWGKYGQKQPTTLEFDFQLYMVQKTSDEPEEKTRGATRK
jgi:hypothetical protein